MHSSCLVVKEAFVLAQAFCLFLYFMSVIKAGSSELGLLHSLVWTLAAIWKSPVQSHLSLDTKQSELPHPILRNSVESDHGCTSRIYFDKAGDNVTLRLYNVMLT